MRYPVPNPTLSVPKAMTWLLGILCLTGNSLLAVDIPGNKAVSAPLNTPGGSLRGEYWKRPVASILTDGRTTRANGIDNQINTFGPPTGTFRASRFSYEGNDLSIVTTW